MDIIDIRSMTYVGEAIKEEHADLLYSQKEFIDFYTKSLEYIENINCEKNKLKERMTELYRVKVMENKPTYHADFESPCGAATGQITYHSNGDIYTCHEALGRDEFRLGNVHEDTWMSVFKKEETAKAILNSMLESNVKCDRCVYKPYCGTCMVENFYHFGKFNYYPNKTFKHHETIFHSRRLFDEIANNIDV